MDGHGTLFGTLAGNHREVLHKVSVDLPKKHGRGGQSALRFARLRLEKRQNYVRKIAELTTQLFITDDRPNVNGLIMAGSADFKNQLLGSDLFDQRLQPHILMIEDVSYGGENGFNQAIELSAETLGNIKFIKEKKLISKYFDEISQDSGKYCFGVNDTLSCLEMGAIETLIVWEDLAVERCVLLNSQTQEEHIHFFTQEQQADDKNMKDPETGVDLELTDKIPMMEWLANEYKNFGCSLEFITDRSEEGSQFVRGFGGIGGILRYQVNLADFEVASDHDDDSDEYSSDGEGYI